MIVIADNSPISVLLSINATDLLKHLFGKIVLTPRVVQEMLAHSNFVEESKEFLSNDWVTVIAPQDIVLVQALEETLDAGEASAIALTKELNADLLLIDERKGRTIAQGLGINITGAIGILVRAKQQGLISSLKEKLDLAKKNNNFRFSEKLYADALKIVGE